MTNPEPSGSFARLPRATTDELRGVVAAILGADHGSPYEPGVPSHAAGGSAAIRKGSQLFAKQLTQFDFDLGGVMLAGPDDRSLVDCGDLQLDPADGPANRAAITAAVKSVLDSSAVPVVLAATIPFRFPSSPTMRGAGRSP
jgi:agmatinase